ncbi:MAG: hypothetical protein JOZ69_15805 [Myxococcales bacterium]|nr:hypothetical protein [Myxococcales bacterium]
MPICAERRAPCPAPGRHAGARGRGADDDPHRAPSEHRRRNRARRGRQQIQTPAQQATIAQQGLSAGLDLELPWALNCSQLESVATKQELVTSATRIIEQKLRFNILTPGGTENLGLKRSRRLGASRGVEPVDVQAGRFQTWEVYYLGMGMDLFTFERKQSGPSASLPAVRVTARNPTRATRGCTP